MVDAKALYDAIKSEVPQISGDKRTQIEVMIVKEKMKSMKTQLRWVSSEVQLSDGLTKIQARQLLADRLRSHKFSLVADSSFQAAKKKSVHERKESSEEMQSVQAPRKAMMIVSSSVQPVLASNDEDSGWDWPLLIFTLLVGLSVLQVVSWVQRCCNRQVPRQRGEARKEEEEDEEMMEESGVQTEEAPRAPPRVEDKTTKLEAKIEQYRDFIRRGNLVNQDLRSTIDDLRTEIEERQMRQDRTDQELGRHQRMIAEIERELQEVRRQAEAARSNLAGIPSRVFISRRGEKYHLRPDCNGMNNATAIRHVDYCSFCSQQVMSTPSMFVPHQDVGRPT